MNPIELSSKSCYILGSYPTVSILLGVALVIMKVRNEKDFFVWFTILSGAFVYVFNVLFVDFKEG